MKPLCSTTRAALVAVLFLGPACADDTTPAADAGPGDVAVADQGAADAVDLGAADAVDLGAADAADLGAPDMSPPGWPPAMDGRFHDWASVPALIADPAGDASGGFDLTTIKVTSRGTSVYLYLDVGKVLNLADGLSAEGTLRILLTPSSGKPLTVDLRGRKAWTGAAPGTALKWTELDYFFAPTYASKVFEGRIDLGVAGAKAGDTVTLDFSGSDALAKPVSFKLDLPAHTPVVRSPDRAAGTTFRLASLNTFLDGLTDPTREAAMGRLVKAAAADVYCFQELFNGTAAAAASVLTALDPRGDGATWSSVRVGDTAIAAPGSLIALPVQYGLQRHVGAAIKVAGRSLVVFTLRPKCCDHIGHASDLLRVAEMNAIAGVIAKLRAGTLGATLLPWQKAPVVVAGDWNMVGSRKPLDVMLDKTAGPGLSHYMPRHLVDGDVHTWYRDKLNKFPPGMLDLLVHSPDLTPRGGHVLDTAELDSATLTKLGLQASDSATSDHLMIVADLAAK